LPCVRFHVYPTSGLKNRLQIVADPLELRKASPDSGLLATEAVSEQEGVDDVAIPDPVRLSPFVDDVVCYIAGYVCFRLRKTVKCMSCQLALMYDYAAGESSLVVRKSHGRLSSAPADVVLLCKRA